VGGSRQEREKYLLKKNQSDRKKLQMAGKRVCGKNLWSPMGKKKVLGKGTKKDRFSKT